MTGGFSPASAYFLSKSRGCREGSSLGRSEQRSGLEFGSTVKQMEGVGRATGPLLLCSVARKARMQRIAFRLRACFCSANESPAFHFSLKVARTQRAGLDIRGPIARDFRATFIGPIVRRIERALVGSLRQCGAQHGAGKSGEFQGFACVHRYLHEVN
jgi:hypothetical protein